MTSIHDALTSLSSAAENDDAFILAAAINLYNENLRRREGRILYHHEDVKRLFDICQTLLTQREIGEIGEKRTFTNKVEIEHVNDVHKAIEDMAKTVERRV
jgi:hypothetical protein